MNVNISLLYVEDLLATHLPAAPLQQLVGAVLQHHLGRHLIVPRLSVTGVVLLHHQPQPVYQNWMVSELVHFNLSSSESFSLTTLP